MRFNRLDNKHFAEEASNNGIFGSAQVGDGRGVLTADYNQIPSLAAFKRGWNAAVITGKKLPPLEEMQGLQSYLSYLINYLYQEGIPLWNSQQAYFNGGYCKIFQNGRSYIYVSLVDNNINQNPLTTTGFWELSDVSNRANVDLSNLSAIGNDKFVTKDTTQTLSGPKTFTAVTPLVLKDSSIASNSTSVIEWHSRSVEFVANDGSLMGLVQAYQADGNYSLRLSVKRNINGNNVVSDLTNTILDDGTSYVSCSTPPLLDTSSKVSTTHWCRNSTLGAPDYSNVTEFVNQTNYTTNLPYTVPKNGWIDLTVAADSMLTAAVNGRNVGGVTGNDRTYPAHILYRVKTGDVITRVNSYGTWGISFIPNMNI